ncbi:hypothetical protein [Herpetosiphon gulosus]|uniref:GxxExxY protein n=1 Tax=Herpetosiphon gulosus TaxID=1973496 RepID=A0ABP9X233_9CHLR
MSNNLSVTMLKRRLNSALRLLVKEDLYLFNQGLHERTIVHKFATYLQIKFSKWDVDVEYNRNITDIKEIVTDSEEKKRIIPDIIIHHRGMSENLLAIEVKSLQKPNRKSIEKDKIKLNRYKEQLGYRYACFILFIIKNPMNHDPYRLETNPEPYKIEWI